MTPTRSQICATVPRLWLMKTIAEFMAMAQLADEVEHRRLDGDVEAGRRLVHDEERGLGDQRHGDDDALLLPARELVRVALQHGCGVGQVDLAEDGKGAGARFLGADALMDHRHFHELPADRHDRVEAAHRVLIDHGDAAAAQHAQLVVIERRHVATLEQDAARGEAAGAAEIAHDGERHGRLAAAGLADEPERLARPYFEAEAGNDIGFTGAQEKRDTRLLEGEDRRGVARPVSHGASSATTASRQAASAASGTARTKDRASARLKSVPSLPFDCYGI